MYIQKTEKGRPINPKPMINIMLGQKTPRGFALRRFAVPA
jgi:hypothetical protein